MTGNFTVAFKRLVSYSLSVIIYVLIHHNGSIEKKEKNTYIQKYTINKNGSRNEKK